MIACQAPLSMEFSRQEYWKRLPFPTPGDLPYPRIKPVSPAFPALAGRFFTTAQPGKPIAYQESIKFFPSLFSLFFFFFNFIGLLRYFKGKETVCNSRDADLIPESGRSLEEENGNPFHYSCLGKPMDRGA